MGQAVDARGLPCPHTSRLDMKRRLNLELPADAVPAKGHANPVTVPQGKRGEDPQLALFKATL